MTVAEITATPEPIRLEVIRFKCPTCRKSWSKRARAVEHAAKCWYSPANKTCKSCKHFEVAESEPEVGFEGYLYCDAKNAELAYEVVPVVACPLWEAVTTRG